MEKIPFDLEKYNTGEYDVVTREDRPARIICTDAKGSQPIVALVSYRRSHFSDSVEEVAHWYNNTGGYFSYGTNALDLFLIPKEKQEPKKEKEIIDDEKIRQIKGILRNSLLVISEKKVKELDETITVVAKVILKIIDDN